MFTHKLVTAIVLAAAVGFPAASYADSVASQAGAAGSHAPCFLDQYRVVSVAPYSVQERTLRNTTQRLAGAEIFVQAEPGLTAEWLQLNLSRHLADMQGAANMRDCAFDVDAVRVEVSSAGPGFFVRLIAPDAKGGQEVLRRAKLLLG